MAAANTIFFYSRHLLPYDSSMALGLLALWVGLRPRPGWSTSLLAGLLASLAFLTYNGYWLGSATVLGLHVVRAAGSWREMARRAVVAAAGLAAIPVLLTAVSPLRHVQPYLAAMRSFSTNAKDQCDFSEGWSLPWAHLWHAEHGLLIVWLVGACVVLAAATAGWSPARTRGLYWLGATAGLYLAMVLFSVGLHRIGTWGRQGRQVVPYLCLTTACAASLLADRHRLRRSWWILGGGLVAVQAAWNFSEPLMQQFPDGVFRRMTAAHGPVGRALTVICPVEEPAVIWAEPGTGSPAATAAATNSRYVLVNAQYFYLVSGTRPPPPGAVVFRTRHPLQYRPYQYEGFLPKERETLRTSDVSIRLIDTQAASGPAKRTDPPPR